MKCPLTLGLPPYLEAIVSDSRLSGSVNPSKMTPPTNCSPANRPMTETLAHGPALGTVDGLRLRARARAGVVGRNDHFWRLTPLGLDIVLLGSAVVASNLASPAAHVPSGGYAWPSIFALVVIVVLVSRGAYARQLMVDLLDDVRSLVVAVGLATMAVVTLRVMFYAAPQQTAAETLRLAVFTAVYLAVGKIGLDLSQAHARRSGETVPTLIIGAGKVGHMAAKRLLEHPELGLRPIGFLDKEPRQDVAARSHLPVLGASWDFEQVVREHGVGQVIITFSTAPNDVLLRMVKRGEELGVGVALVPRLFEKVTDRLTIDHLGGLPLLTSHPSNPHGWEVAIKYALDRLLAIAMLVVCAPIMLIAALATWLSLGRPVLFRQLRVGRDGRTFEMLKFRSMQLNWEVPSEDGGVSMLPDDIAPGGVEEGGDHRTRIGTLLRKTSVDELPQLFNVLKGDMSLIGPRPERPEYVELFESWVYRYNDRLRVKSGITGWAQIHGLRGKTSLSDRVEWDNYYIENWSLWLDIKIALRTALAIPGFFAEVK
jgi:exopolysaccharide biosynthesis polyprenyl glycosylphosphotransferase